MADEDPERLDELERLLALMERHDLEELRLERAGLRVRFRKRRPVASPAEAPAGPSARPAEADGQQPPASVETAGGVPAAETAQADAGAHIVRAPIVGTVYLAREPGAAPFAEPGARVRKGQLLCLIEAMKLMHEIDAEEDGSVVAVFVENGQAVEHGARLMAIEPA